MISETLRTHVATATSRLRALSRVSPLNCKSKTHMARSSMYRNPCTLFFYSLTMVSITVRTPLLSLQLHWCTHLLKFEAFQLCSPHKLPGLSLQKVPAATSLHIRLATIFPTVVFDLGVHPYLPLMVQLVLTRSPANIPSRGYNSAWHSLLVMSRSPIRCYRPFTIK